MKKYIGTKQIEAEPMTMGEADKNGLIAVGEKLSKEEISINGYHVKYDNNIESWLPKEEFEKAYKCADTFLDRLYIEDFELTEKYEKCSAFVDSDKFRKTIKEDYPAFLLHLQREAMGSYLGTLHNRIEYANGAKTEPDTKYGFGEAIEALKFGLAIRRSGWNGKGLFVIKQVPAHIESDIVPKMQSLPQSAKDLILKSKGFVDYTSQCLIYNENTGCADSWVPSISDVFAEDWEIVQ
ncbi:DUF2829 domain-containing protein [Parabacteroides pacaensis]|uniref:DUF2829 domain-containing protein n=1 Tax=Parabacteroides pacaensis TaxID=2086575 RepID=UPI000D0FDB15|nr:DUF2829 domain-containing protein [Parabacteroides pacaensis]